ncbi:MAG TPA: hypothetical protein VKB14_19170, partial [Actinomycetales bacterium]|nr:hypothetical protein [Actinomycetales bacterium]
DLDVLGRVPEPRTSEDWDGQCVSLEVAAMAATSAIEAARKYGHAEGERDAVAAVRAQAVRRLRRVAGRARRRIRRAASARGWTPSGPQS